MGIYEGFKDVLKIVQQVDNIDLYKKLLELQAESLDMSTAFLERDKHIAELQSEIEKLKNALKKKSKVIRYANLYFDKDEKGNAIGYAYCSRCYEVDHVLVHIVQNPRARGTFTCPQCKNIYNWWQELKPKGVS